MFTIDIVYYEEIFNQIRKLETAKTMQQDKNSERKLKSTCLIFLWKHKFLYWELDFPVWFKNCRCNAAFKKKCNTSKDNYRPISILYNISIIYKRWLYNQIQIYFDEIFPKCQCGFRKGFNTQFCLVSMIEKWKGSLDNGRAFCALVRDLSKDFDCLHHELLIAKLDANGFGLILANSFNKTLQMENKGLK